MPVGGNAQVTINVGARLQVLQSSVNEIQKVLDKLQPNSAGFKNLQTILNQITREMDRLQVQASKPFGSQNQFNQTEKTIEKIEDSLNNAQIALSRLNFKDLKLDANQEQQFKDLRNDIAETKKALDSFKNEQKIEMFQNADFKKFADSIDSNLIKKNFSEVAQAVSGESERITNEISKLTSKINQASKEISVGENVEKFTGFLDKDKTIKKQFEQFFTQTEQGLKFKPKQQNAFYEYLKEYFSLNDQQLNALKKLSAQKVQEVMTQEGYFEPQLKKAKNAANRQVSYQSQMSDFRAQAESAAAAVGVVESAEEKIADQSDKTGTTVQALEEKIRQLELQLLGAAQAAPEMKNGVSGMTSELDSMKSTLQQANAQFLQLQRQRQTFESIKSGIINFMGFNQVLNITRNAVRAAIDHIKELDTTMNGIAIVTDMTTADLWKQVDAYSAMAQNFGVTIQGAYEVSKIYYQAGYETNDVLTLTNETLKLSKISGLDYATTTDYMMTAMRGFKLEMEDASRVVDVYSNLAANTAVSQQELAEAMTRTASSMESVGATFEETSAMIATMVAVTRESANNIGSAMKSIASRYGELTKDPAALLDADGEAMSFNKVDTALRSVGITLQTTDHQFRDFTDVIIELAEKWDTLDSAQQRYIATQFAGNRQQSRFLALVSNIDLLQENIANAENSEDVGTLQALKAMDSLESKINQVQVAYQQFYTTIGIESVWKSFLDGAKNVIDTLNEMPKLFGKIPVSAISTIYIIINAIRNVLFSALEGVATNVVTLINETNQQLTQQSQSGAQEVGETFFDVIKRIIHSRKFEITQEMSNMAKEGVDAAKHAAEGQGAAGVLQIDDSKLEQTSNKVSTFFKNVITGGTEASKKVSKIGDAFTIVGTLINTATDAGQRLSGVLTLLGGSIKVLTAASASNPLLAILTGALTAYAGFKNIVNGFTVSIEELERQAENLNNIAKEEKANYSLLQRNIKKYEELKEERYKSAESAEEYQKTVDELAESFPELISGFDEAGNIIIETSNAEAVLTQAREKSAAATYEAAKKEAEVAKNRLEESKDAISNPVLGEARYSKTQASVVDQLKDLIFTDDSKLENKYADLKNLQLYPSFNDVTFNRNPDDWVRVLYNEYNKELDWLNNYVEEIETDTGISWKINKEGLLKNLKELQENNPLDSIQQIVFDYLSSSLEELDGQLANAIKDLQKYQGEDLLSEPGRKAYNKVQTIISQILAQNGGADFLNEYYAGLQESLGNLGNAITDIESLENIFKSRVKVEAETWVNKANKSFGNNSLKNAFINLAEQQAVNNNQTFSQWAGPAHINAEKLSQAFINFYNSLDETNKKLFDEYTNNTDLYSYSDLEKQFFAGQEETLEAIIKGYKDLYNPEGIKQAIQNAFSARNLTPLYDQFLNEKDFTGFDREFIEQQLQTYDTLLNSKMPRAAGTYISSLLKLYEDITPDERKILSSIDNYSSEEEINNILENLPKDGFTAVKEYLNFLKDNIINNLALTLQMTIDAIAEKTEENKKELKNAIAGMSLKEATDLISKLGDEYSLENDVKQINGEYVLTAESAKKYYNTLINENKDAKEKIEQAYNELKDVQPYTENDYKKLTEDQKKLLTTIGIDFASLESEENGYTDSEKIQIINEQIANFRKNYSHLLWEIEQSSNELNKVLEDQIKSRYNSLIEDFLAGKYKAENYTDLDLSEIDFSSNVNFIHSIEKYAQKTTEEINSLVVQAMEKDIASTTGAAQDALRDIDFYSPTSALASRDTLQKLADALGVRIEELYNGYIESLDQYSVDVSKIPLDKITNSADILFDSINSVINSITDYINNGLNGKLKAADVTNLNAQLERYGIQQLSAADFTRTKEGLQLSEQAAFRLYEDLRKIDGIQSQITFNDLAQSLKETNEHYKDFSSIIARINELDSKPSSARSEEYERELRIAKEIAAVRLTTDGGGFNFMNNDLPAGMQNPIDYIDSWGKAFKTLNEATTATGDSKNLIDATAFYNIVNELNNLAAIGDDIEFMGYTLDGSLESASELIQKGFNSLKNIDGEGTKVDLSNFGVDFASGADQMNANIENGIHELAASQVAMLDAMIQLLETIVAMEELGDIDIDSDGLLNFDEFIDTTTDIPLFTEKYQKWRDSILQAINPDDIEHYNEDIANALNAVKVNNESLKDIVSKSAKDFTQTDAQILNALYQAAKSNNWDLDNIAASMKEVLLGSGLEGTIEVGDMKFAIKYGQVFEIDSDNKVLDDNGKTHNTIEEAALENAKNLVSGSKEKVENAVTTAYDSAGNIVATFKINENVNLEVIQTPSGETTYRINGEDYSSQSAALFAYYQSLSQKEQDKYSSYQDFILSITGEIIPEITVANENELKGATQDKINELAQALISGTTDEVKTAAATVGIAIDVEGELTAEQRKQIAELAGIESKNVALNITANYTGDSAKALGELLEKDPIEIDATVNITDVNDESGKLNVGEDGKVKITDLTASGLGTITLNDCEFSVVDGTAKITKDGNQIAFIPLENLEATGIGELPEGNCTFTYVPGEGITISNGIVSVTIPEEVLRGTGSLDANNTEVKYDGDAPKVSNEEIDVPLDNYLKGTGTLTSGACSIIYQGDAPYVSFENGTLNIPLNDYLKAGGTLTKDNCHIVYNAGTDKLDVYDENNQLLGAIPVPLDFESTDGVLENVQVTFSEKGLEIIKDGKSITGGPIPLEDLTAEGTGDLLSLALQWLGGKENIDTSKVIPAGGLDLGTTAATVKVTQITPEIEEAVRNDLINRINKTIATASEWPEANVSAVTKPSTAVNMLSNAPDHVIQNKVVEAQVKVETEEAEKKLESVKQKNEDVHDTITGTTSKINVDNSEANSKLNTTESEAYQTRNALNNVKGTGFFNNSQIISAIDQVINKVQEGISALANLSSATASVSVSTSSGSGSGQDPYNYIKGMATGNVALAKGRGTLMGELGPELYITGGHYYVAGQTGAEFVNLPPDAIVFNHLQTERLLKNGSAGRGRAVTNERKATSLATGNVTGPAMASASAALAALKQIRAMWDSMLKASLSDLGSKAGLGKKAGGGGGSNDKGQTVKLDSGYIRDLERWYNLLRQIDRLEQDINYEEKLRSKLQADTVANGELIYESQRRTYEMLQRELDDRVELASLKKGYYEQRMAEIQAGPWGQLFYFNEEGVPQMKNLQFLADVFASSDEGGAVHNAREQYAMLQQAGFGSLLQYKEDGSIIEWTDDEGKPREDAYKEAVEAFSAKLDAQTEEVNSLREDYIEEMGNILDLQTQQNEILTQIRENTIAVEQEVLKAIEDSREREIDELQKQRDALSDSTDRFIDGLTDSLNKEREMYNSQQEDTELLQMRRQLAILQRSGGSASQIRSLQEQIRQREQEAYFEEQENQINAIKEASDLQLERLDAQISLMQETLEYQKAQGLLWDQVHEVMQGTHEEITQFVTGNNSEWWAKSAAQTQNDLVELDNKIGQWVAHRDDISTLGETMKNAINNGIAAITSVVAKVSESQSYTVSGTGSYVLPSSSNSGTGGTGGVGGYSGGTPSTTTTKKSSNKTVSAAKSSTGTLVCNYVCSGKYLDSATYSNQTAGATVPYSAHMRTFSGYTFVSASPSSVTIPSGGTVTMTYNYTLSSVKKKVSALSKGIGGCFVAGSKVIMANGVKKNIEEIKIGEEVIAYNDKENKFEPKKVVKAYAHYNTPRVLEITLSNGVILGITPGHPILTIKGWKSRDIENSLYEHGVQAEWLEIGDEVLGFSGNAIVTSIEEKNIPNNYTTYNIEVETCHTYLVDGLVVHNAKVVAPMYAKGGLIDYTGPAWVDGTKKKPEGILNAEQLKMLRNSVLTRKNPVAALLADYGNTVSNTANANTYSTINHGESMSIGNVELNMNVARIANDYDARRAGEKALEQMVKIAQKNGVNNIKRR